MANNKVVWTEDQKHAINDRAQNILVSAAAGSGKTKILIERIVKMLTDDNALNIDNFLIATFTDAAATEMKERLLKRIREMVNDKTIDPDIRQHMQQQIYLIPSANISTFHAFCLSVIKKFYYVIDFDPNFRLLSDDTEQSIMKEQAYQNVINDYYANDFEEFARLSDNFTDEKDDTGLWDVIDKIYNFAVTNAETEKWLDGLVKPYEFNQTFSDSDFFQNSLMPVIRTKVSELQLDIQHGKQLCDADTLTEKYLDDSFTDATNWVKKMITALESNNYDTIRTQLNEYKIADKKRFKLPEDSDTTTLDQAVVIKGGLKGSVDELKAFFIKPEAGINDVLKDAQFLISKLVKVERSYMAEYTRLKINNHVIDFNDLEHLTVQILQQQVDGHNVAANFYQHKFREMMVDEYQDVNAMQEKIVQLLKIDHNNLFMVGDIKQSIYGFRQAAPYIFTGKYDEFQKDTNDDKLIQLSKNFRSSLDVVNFVNDVFKKIFDKRIGDIDYDDSSKLVHGKPYADGFDPKTLDTENEFNIITLDKSDDNKKNSNNDDDDRDKGKALIAATAQRIQQLMRSHYQVYDNDLGTNRDIRYSDIAILSRTSSYNTDLISLFTKNNIPVMVKRAENYFQTSELMVMISMLNIIDNPYQDVPLLAVLRSPIVHLNEEELAQIRLLDKDEGIYYENYYATILKYLQKSDADPDIKDKLENFLVKLNSYRDFANQNSLARLIWKIYQETGFLEYSAGMPGGKQRAANLHALYKYADSYESNNSKGLHQFLIFIQKLRESNKDLTQPSSIEATDDTVKVMTIHGSKGLEFPIVILMDLKGKFNSKDYTAATLFDSKLGIGIKVLNNESRLVYSTAQRQMISDKRKLASLSENMRLLYVALTRAEQKLIMFGSTTDPEKIFDKWDTIEVGDNGVIDEGSRSNTNSFQDLIGMSTMSENDRKLEKDQTYINENCHLKMKFISPADIEVEPMADSNSADSETVELSGLFKDSVNKILDFKYDYQKLVETTAYQSVSEIKDIFADPIAGEMGDYEPEAKQNTRYNLNSFARPQFLTTTKKITSAEIGSATHLVLQKIKLDKTPQQEDFDELIQDMVNNKQMTSELADKINTENLAGLYQDKLGQMIVDNAEHVSREYPVSILMPVQDLFKNDDLTGELKDKVTDKILVHGIIDGVIELPEGIIIFDYKTDHVTDQNKSELIAKYSGQLNLYAKAISAIKHKKVLHEYLYFLKITEAQDLLEK